MNKKAIVAETLADILGWFGFIVVILISMYAFSLLSPVSKLSIDAEGVYANQDFTLLNILRTPVTPYENIADYIAYAKTAGKDSSEYNLMKSALNNALNKIYGRAQQPCWKLYIDDDNFAKQGDMFLCLKILDHHLHTPALQNYW
jgi:hypothetical protein